MHVFWPFACCAKIGVLDDGSELNVETLVISAFFFSCLLSDALPSTNIIYGWGLGSGNDGRRSFKFHFLRSFAHTFPTTPLWKVYGPTETTVDVAVLGV
jgi:hypothetical protein